MSASPSTARTASAEGAMRDYVTMTIAGQMFGLPLACVRDVFRLGQLTRLEF